MLSEQIKSLRKSNNLTQEQLAERINVSRQAITKWETGAGVPDIANMSALARTFGVSVDTLLSDEAAANPENVSRTEFDIFGKSDFHLNVGTANRLEVSAIDVEKVIVEIRSDLPAEAYKLAKVRLTEGNRVDLTVEAQPKGKRSVQVTADKRISRQEAKAHLFLKVLLPESLANHVEIEGTVQELCMHDLTAERHIEFDGKADRAELNNLCGHLELTSGTDMEIVYDGSLRQLDINQLRCISNLILAKDTQANVYSKGRGCRVLFDGFENKPDAAAGIELNGYQSELTVRARS